MKLFYTIIIILLIGMFGVSSYMLWESYNNLGGIPFITKGNADYGSFNANLSFPKDNRSQFYPNMRYKSSRISYWIEPRCDSEKEKNMIEAFAILSDKTILNFYAASKEDAEISVLCSKIAPEPEEEGHFIAGEGGPSRIINTSVYSVILTGRIALYRGDKCDKPQVALHELLHALGFDHRSDKTSIMYPITSCDLKLDDSIVNEINSLYSVPAEPDLAIGRVTANKTGRYLNFGITLVNYGLADMDKVVLKVIFDGKEIKEVNMGNMTIGIIKTLNVENLKLPSGGDGLTFEVRGDKNELSTTNNHVHLVLKEG